MGKKPADTGRAERGALKRRVMEVMWAHAECTGKEVHELLCTERPMAYTTLMTVMNRLVERGVLERTMRGQTGVYRAATSRDEAEAAELVDQLVSRYGALGLAKFVERSSSADMLTQLHQLVEQQARKQAGRRDDA